MLNFVATGGYALSSYERFARIRRGKDGLWRVATPLALRQYRMNVGTIVESTQLKVRLGRARPSRPAPRRRARWAGACSAKSRSISPRP